MARPADRGELDRLVRSQLGDWLKVATRLTGNPADAEDVVQDALVRIVKSWSQFRGQAAFRTWSYRILLNAFYDRYRKPRDRPEHLDAEAAARQLGPDELAQVREVERKVAGFVSALPLRQRSVVVLICYEQLSAPEVAEVLGMSIGNVYSTLSQARKRLWKQLSGHLTPEDSP